MNDQQTQSIMSTSSKSTQMTLWMMISGFALNQLGFDCSDYWIVFIRSLQIILNLPIFQVMLPGNIITFINIFMQVAQYDLINILNNFYDIWDSSFA